MALFIVGNLFLAESMLFASLTSSPLVMQFAIFGAFAAFAWWVMDMVSNRKPRAEQRLQDIRDPTGRKTDLLRDKGNGGVMASMLEKAAPALSKPMQSTDEGEISKTKEKLNVAGFRSENAVLMYNALRMASFIGGFFIGGGAVPLGSRF